VMLPVMVPKTYFAAYSEGKGNKEQ